MPWTIIVASGDGYQQELLMEGAQEIATAIAEAGPVVMEAESVGEVQKRRRTAARRRQLLIVSATLPDEARPTVKTAGLGLVQSIATDTVAPLCILVSGDPSHLALVQEIDGCELLFVNNKTNYVQDCLRLAKRLKVFADSPPSSAERSTGLVVTTGAAPSIPQTSAIPATNAIADDLSPYAVIELHLWDNARAFLTQPDWSSVPLELNENQLDEIMNESRALADCMDKARVHPTVWQQYVTRWRDDYKRLGERIGDLLWPTVFGARFWMSRTASKGNLRLRFNLAPRYFEGAWEALYDRQITNNFVMLEGVTVARRSNSVVETPMIGESSVADRIAVDDGVLNILIIASNVPDNSTPEGPADPLWEAFWSRLGGGLPALPHIEREVAMLQELERAGRGVVKAGRRLPRVKVEVLSSRPGEPLAKIVEDRLKDRSRPYDVVHFAGHALFDRNAAQNCDRRGYLVFSGAPGMRPTAVPIGSVAEWLRDSGVQLVYLSCCRSSSFDAASELAALKVPLTIGFNWNLDDAKAIDFATNFYTELVAARFRVGEAFRKARHALHKYFSGGDPIWAAPVLIAQPSEWTRVESALRPVTVRSSAAKKRHGQPRRPRGPSSAGSSSRPPKAA